jgi:hypothetical protein
MKSQLAVQVVYNKNILVIMEGGSVAMSFSFNFLRFLWLLHTHEENALISKTGFEMAMT